MSNYFGRTMQWGELWFRFQPCYVEVNTLPCYEQPYISTRMYFRFMDDEHMMDNMRAIIAVFNMGWYDCEGSYWTSKRVRELDEKHEIIGNTDHYTLIPWVDHGTST